ncbi:MAG: excinuclease ABC subunit UvrA [Armatimonadetes bacterium]|nr:excinuclease ABC subunit UvrA [Planctomycetota bacterium]MBI2201174.1 excinuclease ABC subunit UvrA [Armatimonadota bacterium]
MERSIVIQGAAQHNLQHLDITLPRDRLIVITGLSGSGKSSLAFDTIYAEGQRRYVESLSAYARQFLEQLQKPEVERIEGLPPTIAIEQRQAASSPRSIVATTTEIYDYLRLLYARAGEPHCHLCGRPITRQSAEEMVEFILRKPEGVRLVLLAPLVRGRKGEHREAIEHARREGFVRFRIDGVLVEAEALPDLDKKRSHRIEVVVDRLVVRPGLRSRLQDSLETALRVGGGLVTVSAEEGGAWGERVFSEHYACPDCGVSLEELAPRTFSFNSPYGACPGCAGLGLRLEFDLDLIVPDPKKTLAEGAFEVLMNPGIGAGQKYHRQMLRYAKSEGIDVHLPFASLDERARGRLLRQPAAGRRGRWRGFEGVLHSLERRFQETDSEPLKERLMAYMSEMPCPECRGARLRAEALAVTFGGRGIHEVLKLTVSEAASFFTAEAAGAHDARISGPILKDVRARLAFLQDVGLGYLTLDRPSRTLSGGEWQRIRLATQAGSSLVGVCYVLDEPTIGLHPRDGERLIRTLLKLRDLGNTVIVVEHDEQVIRAADHLLDLGPGAGTSGGRVVAQGSLPDLVACPESLTGQYLSEARRIPMPARRRPLSLARAVRIVGARANNLKSVTVDFPLGGLVCVTGVSGSGKSTLVHQTLLPALRRLLHGSKARPGDHDQVLGAEAIDKVIEIDQSPIGRTPRSNPATYTGLFDDIRRLFARLKESRVRGYAPGRFSFNVKGGRCEACEGQGARRIEMHFLPDLFVPCEVCRGQRFNRETLEVRFHGRQIAEVLETTVDEALELFRNVPPARRILETLRDVGLGYVALGQSSTTLSGGEAQRIKLAAELAKSSTERTLYVLDEPTTGLHFEDIRKLLEVLNRLADRGSTLIVVEHNLEVIQCADWIIDLGPEGGGGGGRVVASGTPESLAQVEVSATGRFLRQRLGK